MDIPAQVNINKETRVSLATTLGIALSTLDTVMNKKFWEELITNFPFATN
jgi:hypothetical protein